MAYDKGEYIIGGRKMRFDNEALFVSLVSNYGMNLYLGAGFSVYADNEAGEKLPLGNEINKHLIDVFGLKTNREYTLSKSCQKIKKDNKDALERLLKETYRVKSFDKMYTGLCRLPIKNIITLNIDNLVERIYEDESSTKIIADNNITGPLEKNNVVNLYKLHGSVTYPMGSDMSFTDKELTDHALTYARNAIRYYEKFGKDEFSESYIDSATVQLNSIIDSKEYIYRPVLREMKTLLSELREIKSVY